MRAFLPALLGVVFLLHNAQAAVAGINKDGSLDRAQISKAYFEGDFDMVVSALETFRKLHPDLSREDKIYAYKYLSVIYAAKPETRPKAESFMYQLLKLMPSIELMDLYISDNIEAIFNSVRIRFEQQQKLAADPDQRASGSPIAGPGTMGKASAGESASLSAKGSANGSASDPGKDRNTAASLDASGKGSTWVWWTAGAAVGVAAAVAGYVYLSDSPSDEPSPDVVDLK